MDPNFFYLNREKAAKIQQVVMTLFKPDQWIAYGSELCAAAKK